MRNIRWKWWTRSRGQARVAPRPRAGELRWGHQRVDGEGRTNYAGDKTRRGGRGIPCRQYADIQSRGATRHALDQHYPLHLITLELV